MSYDEYLKRTGKEASKEAWIDWKVEICGMSYIEARKVCYDLDWGYEE